MGIQFRKDRNTWSVTSQQNGKRVRLTFKTEEEALAKWRELNPKGWRIVEGGRLLDEARSMISALRHGQPVRTVERWETSLVAVETYLGNSFVKDIDAAMIRQVEGAWRPLNFSRDNTTGPQPGGVLGTQCVTTGAD